MAWKKLGNIFSPKEHNLLSHAQVPTVHVTKDTINIYFSSRNEDGKSFPYKAAFDLNNPTQLIEFNNQPIMGLGAPGTFDDDGVMPSAILESGDSIKMYYSGWNQRTNTPYHNSTGLAQSKDGGDSFQRIYEGPVLDRTHSEPYLAVTPSILFEDDMYKMWYVSGLRWQLIKDKYEPVYVIKHAYSKDGVRWERPSHICIPQHYDLEAFSHPSVIKENGQYHMWYCYRGSEDYRNGANSYRMGYATSMDGINWERDDNNNIIQPSGSGWDAAMICYPYVFFAQNKKYMVYNGNGFGQSGFGLAIWEDK